MQERQEYLSAEQLSVKLSIPRNTLYAIALHGDFPRGIKIGRARRWLASEIEAYLAAQAQKQHEQEREEFSKQLLSGERSK